MSFKLIDKPVAERILKGAYHECVIVTVKLSSSPFILASFAKFNTDSSRSIYDNINSKDSWANMNINGLVMPVSSITYITEDDRTREMVKGTLFTCDYLIWSISRKEMDNVVVRKPIIKNRAYLSLSLREVLERED